MTILARHALAVSLINRDRLVSYLVRDYFDLSRKTTLMQCLLTRGLGQADLVLCLLHVRDHQRHPDWRRVLSFYVRLLVGRPILVGEPCLLRYRTNGGTPRVSSLRVPDDRKIIWVLGENPRQPQTDAHARWREFQPGRTVRQLRARGVTRKDLRRAVRKNWIRLEEIA